uniref:Uncharacterized protein n=1 Tax=Micromonas pusilla TaxID=38833 RepID=A0A7R9XWE4_MICPS
MARRAPPRALALLLLAFLVATCFARRVDARDLNVSSAAPSTPTAFLRDLDGDGGDPLPSPYLRSFSLHIMVYVFVSVGSVRLTTLSRDIVAIYSAISSLRLAFLLWLRQGDLVFIPSTLGIISISLRTARGHWHCRCRRHRRCR